MMHKNFISVLILLFGFLGGCTTTGSNQTKTTTDQEKTARLNLELGMAYMEKKDYEKAMKRLQKAIKIDPRYADAHNAIAILYSRLGEDEKAGTHFKKAVELAPDDPGALNNYGQYLCSHDQREQAETMFKRALENPLYRTPEIAHLNAGICAKENGDLEQAEIHFRAALKKNPKLAPALFQMADLSFQLKRYLQARAYLERYASVARHNPRTLWLAIRTERALGNQDAEASYALQLKNQFPDAQETRLLLKSEAN